MRNVTVAENNVDEEIRALERVVKFIRISYNILSNISLLNNINLNDKLHHTSACLWVSFNKNINLPLYFIYFILKMNNAQHKYVKNLFGCPNIYYIRIKMC